MKNITIHTLLNRINRRLSHDDLIIRKTRESSRWSTDLGDYYMVDLKQNAVVGTNIRLTTEVLKLGVLRPTEVVA